MPVAPLAAELEESFQLGLQLHLLGDLKLGLDCSAFRLPSFGEGLLLLGCFEVQGDLLWTSGLELCIFYFVDGWSGLFLLFGFGELLLLN